MASAVAFKSHYDGSATAPTYSGFNLFPRMTHTQLLRYAGLFTWAMVGVGLLMNARFVISEQSSSVDGIQVRWIGQSLAYIGFGFAYWLATHSFSPRDTKVYEILLLLVMSAGAITVSQLAVSGLGAIMMMITAGVIPWLVPLRVGIIWLILQQMTLVPVFMTGQAFSFPEALLQSILYVGFSGLVFVTGLVANQQAQAREEQRRLNAELRATRALLAESTRVSERLRISRELHDLLGHHLTALSLNLEVASHLTDGKAQEHVKQSHSIARLLLTDVREAVSTMREDDALDIATAIRTLVEGVPSMNIQLTLEKALLIDDPACAHVLLRCTQEIITNTVRHSGARTLWLDIVHHGKYIELSARDDGVGVGNDEFSPGNGLTGMRERVAEHGGVLEICTEPGKGFALKIRMPTGEA